MADTAALADVVRGGIADVPDFPQPGVLFRDVTPLLADGPAYAGLVAATADLVGERYGDVDVVAGVEARGFLLAAPLAVRLGAGFVPVRKPGKLPRAVHRAAYGLEYGRDELQVHVDAVRPGARVLVVDDVLATGGTAAAACELVERAGGHLLGVLVLVELEGLDGRSRLPGRDLTALLPLP